MNYNWAANKEKMQRAIGTFAGSENVTEKMIYDEYVKIGGLVIESEVPETFSDGTEIVSDEESTETDETVAEMVNEIAEEAATPEVSDEESTEESGN